MYYEVYIESLFFTNLCLNLLLLGLLCRVLKCTATHLHLLLGAGFGALCECILILFVPCTVIIKMLIAYGVVSPVMVKIGLRITGRKQIVKATIALFCMAFTLEGMISFLVNQLQLVKQHRVKVIEFAGIVYLSYWMVCFFLKKRKEQSTKGIYQVELLNAGKRIKLQALLDTGNGLVEPVSGQPVCIVENAVLTDMQPYEEQKGYCVIPYHSLGKRNGILPGFCVEQMEIQGEWENIVCRQTVVGVYEGKINQRGEYQMILHPKLLEN